MNIYIPNQNDIIHETSVDFVLRPCTKEIHIVQYDKSLPIVKVELFRNGERYALSENAVVNVRVGKLDRTFVYKPILGTNEERNIIYFEIDEQMALIPGKIWPVIEVIETNRVACSSPLCFIIEKNPIQNGQIESEDYFPIIYELQKTLVSQIEEITYSDLKNKRDNSLLIPGKFYRIIDYQCTTVQFDTKSAGHQFDIIVRADSKNTLNENARAAKHKGIVETRIFYHRGDPAYYVGDYLTFLDDYEFNGQLCGRWVKHEPGADFPDDIPRYVILNARVINGQLDKELNEIEEIAIILVDDESIDYPRESEVVPWGEHAHTFDRIELVDVSGDYFANCHLEAWELKYCLDNDTTRFNWANTIPVDVIQTYDENTYSLYIRSPEHDTNGLYAWAYKLSADVPINISSIDYNENTSNDFVYTRSTTLKQGDDVLDQSSNVVNKIYSTQVRGTGVIYYMKDEWNNECPYDFKNIMFKRYKVTDITKDGILSDLNGKYLGYIGNMKDLEIENEGDFIWAYTFNALDVNKQYFDCSVKCPINLSGMYAGSEELRVRNNLIESYFEKVSIDNGALIAKQVLNNITFQMLDLDLSGITIKENIIKSECHNLSFLLSTAGYIDSFCYDMIFGDYFINNTFGNGCRLNTFNNGLSNNTFGNSCSENTFGHDCYFNIFGNDCHSNTFGHGCSYNTFGNGSSYNTFDHDCSYNTFGNRFTNNTFGNDCHSNTFGNRFANNTFSNYCYLNTFGNDCHSNTFGHYCHSNTLGNECYFNTLSDYARWNIFENGVIYTDLRSNEAGSNNYQLQNITIRQGIQGTNNNRKVITESRGLEHDVTYRAANAEDKTI